jgi:hypothetical protein
MKKLLLLLSFFLLTSVPSYSQTVGRNVCKIFLESYDSKEDDGELVFEIDCRMVDCLLEMEISNDERRKKKVFQYWIYERNYYLNEDSLIIMRMNLGNMKSLMDDHQSILMTVTIYSMSSYPVFRRLMPFDRPLLIRTYQVNKHE